MKSKLVKETVKKEERTCAGKKWSESLEPVSKALQRAVGNV